MGVGGSLLRQAFGDTIEYGVRFEGLRVTESKSYTGR